MDKYFLLVLIFLSFFQTQAFEGEPLSDLVTPIPRSIIDYRPHFENMMHNPANPVLRLIFSSRYVGDFKRLECVDLLMRAKAKTLAIYIGKSFENPKIVRSRLKSMTYLVPEPDDPEILDLLEEKQKNQTQKLEEILKLLNVRGKYALALSALRRMGCNSDTLLSIKKEARKRLDEEQRKRRVGL